MRRLPVNAIRWISDKELDDLRRLRVNADIALCRANPGWFCVMFHYGEHLVDQNLWRMFYSIQQDKDSDPKVYQVMLGRVRMADGSQVWGVVNEG